MIEVDYHSSKNQQILGEFVRKNVIYCVSYMVDAVYKLMGNCGRLNDIDYSLDDMMNIIDMPDYESACENNDIDVYYSRECEGYMFTDRDGEESETYNTFYQACEAAVEHFDLDYDYKEAYEHWIVDKRLGEKLEEHGEMVIFDFLGLECIWGRTCTGQAILLDHVIGEIAEEMEILEGQKYEWEV